MKSGLKTKSYNSVWGDFIPFKRTVVCPLVPWPRTFIPHRVRSSEAENDRNSPRKKVSICDNEMRAYTEWSFRFDQSKRVWSSTHVFTFYLAETPRLTVGSKIYCSSSSNPKNRATKVQRLSLFDLVTYLSNKSNTFSN